MTDRLLPDATAPTELAGRRVLRPERAIASLADLSRAIHERHEDMGEASRRIAAFLLECPDEAARRSVTSIARQLGVHPSSIVRFAQAFGFAGYKDLRPLFKLDPTSDVPSFASRLRLLDQELQEKGRGIETAARNGIVRDVASIEQLLYDVDEAALSSAVDLLLGAGHVFLAGHGAASPVASFLRYVLSMLGLRSILLDQSGGLAGALASTMDRTSVLVAISFHPHPGEVVEIAAQAVDDGVPVIAMTDASLSPLARQCDVLFIVPGHEDRTTRSLVAPMCLSQAMAVGIAARLQQSAPTPRISTVTSRESHA